MQCHQQGVRDEDRTLSTGGPRTASILPSYLSSREFPDFKSLVWCMKDTEMSTHLSSSSHYLLGES